MQSPLGRTESRIGATRYNRIPEQFAQAAEVIPEGRAVGLTDRSIACLAARVGLRRRGEL
jgi:hypothetical protein